MTRKGNLRVCAAFVALLVPKALAAVQAPSPIWIRVVNAVGGSIRVRLGDTGAWVTLGAVLQPATRTAPGFGAGRWAEPGTVAATAVHGIRIRIADGEFGPMFSLVPRQFVAIPEFYGGHVPGDSGIRTDIAAGETLFREFAPLTGSPVYLETGSGPMPIPGEYSPAPGDVILVKSVWAADSPSSIEFENHKGGRVTARYSDGTVELLGTVSQSLSGTGRFDGTSFTGVGAINTNHPGVITVSTAPVVATDVSEGASPERRGGFEISPAQHVRDQAGGSPQVLGVAPLKGQPGLEGTFPLFCRALGLWAGSDADPGFHAELKVDDGAWQAFPAILGRDDAAFTAAGLSKYLRSASTSGAMRTGVSALRIVLPQWSDNRSTGWIESARKARRTEVAEPTGVYAAIRGNTTLQPVGVCQSVTYLVDGQVRAVFSTDRTYWQWDTTVESNGRHYVVIRSIDATGHLKEEVRRVIVLNRRA